jgi:hypothetical protein
MSATVITGSKSLKPFGVISQEAREEVEKEKALVFRSSPLANRSRFFSPNSPPPLAGDDLRSLETTHYSLTRSIDFLMDFLDWHQAIRG